VAGAGESILVLGLALAPCVAILAYWLRRVRTAPEPGRRVAAAVLAGAAAFGLAVLVQRGLAELVGRRRLVLWSFLVVATSEELLKLLAVLLAGPRPTRYARVSSGLVYGVAAGVGFAAAENLAYAAGFGTGVVILRAVTAVPGHVLHSALVGLGLGEIHRARRRRDAVRGLLINTGLAISVHGLYDAILLGAAEARGLVVLLLAAEAWLVLRLFRRDMERDLFRDIAVLREVPFLRDSPVAAIRVLAERAVRRQVEADHLVIRKGHAGDAMFIVLRGQLSVRDGDRELARVPSGGFFGEQALLNATPRNADVVSLEPSLLLRVNRGALYHAIDQVEGLAMMLTVASSDRLVALPSVEEVEGAAAAAAAAARDYHRVEAFGALLAHVDLFAGLRATDRAEIAAACTEVLRGAGSVLVRRGGSGWGLCVIVAGEAEVLRGGRHVATLVDGDFFGELNLLTGWPASATVRAVSPVRLALLRWDELYRILGRHPEVGWRLLRALERRAERFAFPGRPGWTQRLARLLAGRASLEGPAAELREAFVELDDLSPTTAETLAAHLEPGVAPEPARDSLWLGARADRRGVVVVDGRPDPNVTRWWRARETTMHDAIALAPDVVRFLARLVAGSASGRGAWRIRTGPTSRASSTAEPR
jgi:CRP-like cAMP-binding protein/RsiW-degrading membrane proteinase PrsW (M82 family)